MVSVRRVRPHGPHQQVHEKDTNMVRDYHRFVVTELYDYRMCSNSIGNKIMNDFWQRVVTMLPGDAVFWVVGCYIAGLILLVLVWEAVSPDEVHVKLKEMQPVKRKRKLTNLEKVLLFLLLVLISLEVIGG